MIIQANTNTEQYYSPWMLNITWKHLALHWNLTAQSGGVIDQSVIIEGFLFKQKAVLLIAAEACRDIVVNNALYSPRLPRVDVITTSHR